MIPRDICQRVLEKAASTGADYAELFAEHTDNHAINMVDSRVDSIDDTLIAGASVRVFKGLRSVTASHCGHQPGRAAPLCRPGRRGPGGGDGGDQHLPPRAAVRGYPSGADRSLHRGQCPKRWRF